MSKKSKPFLAHSEITDCIYIIDWHDKYEVTEQCISAMKATSRMPRWIPVSERLPEVGQRVIATVESIDGNYVRETICGKYGLLCGNGIAWMPLPEPYKSEIPTGAESEG